MSKAKWTARLAMTIAAWVIALTASVLAVSFAREWRQAAKNAAWRRELATDEWEILSTPARGNQQRFDELQKAAEEILALSGGDPLGVDVSARDGETDRGRRFAELRGLARMSAAASHERAVEFLLAAIWLTISTCVASWSTLSVLPPHAER